MFQAKLTGAGTDLKAELVKALTPERGDPAGRRVQEPNDGARTAGTHLARRRGGHRGRRRPRPRAGEFLAVIGPNGAGKTSLFNLDLRAAPADRRHGRLHGDDVTGLAPHRRARLGLGRTFQSSSVFGSLTRGRERPARRAGPARRLDAAVAQRQRATAWSPSEADAMPRPGRPGRPRRRRWPAPWPTARSASSRSRCCSPASRGAAARRADGRASAPRTCRRWSTSIRGLTRRGRPQRAHGGAPHGRGARPGRPGRGDAPRRAARLRHPGHGDGQPRPSRRPTSGRSCEPGAARRDRPAGAHRGSHILQGVTFDVPPTGVTVLLGRNGVGKTTTLKALLGLTPAGAQVDGDVAFDGVRRDRASRPTAWSGAAGLRAGGPGRLRRADRGREPAAGRARRPARLRHRVTRCSPSCPGGPAAGRHAVRRPAADAGHRPGAAQPQPAAADRRADQGPGPEGGRPRSPTCWTGWPSRCRCCWSSRTWPWSAGSAATRSCWPPGGSPTPARWPSLLGDAELTRSLLGVGQHQHASG